MNPNQPGIGPPLATVHQLDVVPIRTQLDQPLHLPEADREVNRWFSGMCRTNPPLDRIVWEVNNGRTELFTISAAEAVSGCDYQPDTNRLLVSPKYLANPYRPLLWKLVLFRLSEAFARVPLARGDADAVRLRNQRQTALLNLANPVPTGQPPVGMVRMYHGTNRFNFYIGSDGMSIQRDGLKTAQGGMTLGCKRWEGTIIRREYKDLERIAATLDYTHARGYAAEHTEWALGRKQGALTVRDLADYGGMVISFDVPANFADQKDTWRHDDSGASQPNWQASKDIDASRIAVVEELAIPHPPLVSTPPPTG